MHEKDRRFDSKRTPFQRVARGLAFALLATLIAGCSVGPRYGKPSTRLQPFHNAPAIDSSPATAPPAALEAWWTGFQDPELTRIVERVFQENLDLSASLARVQQARAAAKEAGAQLKPSASLIGQDDWFRQSLDSSAVRYAGQVPNFSRNQSYLDLGVAATWEVDLFGGLRRGVEAATDEAQAAEALHLGTRIIVAAEAADWPLPRLRILSLSKSTPHGTSGDASATSLPISLSSSRTFPGKL